MASKIVQESRSENTFVRHHCRNAHWCVRKTQCFGGTTQRKFPQFSSALALQPQCHVALSIGGRLAGRQLHMAWKGRDETERDVTAKLLAYFN